MTTSVTLNDAGDILYVRLRDGNVAKTRAFGDDRLVDFDANGMVIGAEFIGIETSSTCVDFPMASGSGTRLRPRCRRSSRTTANWRPTNAI